MAGLRIEAGGRLVEEQQVRLVDQRAGDRQAPLHPARQRLDLVVGALGRAGRTRAARRRGARLRRGTGRSTGRRSAGSRGPSARCRACPAGARRRCRARIAGPSRRGSQAEDAQRAVADRRDAADHPHRRGLAGAVRAKEAERLRPARRRSRSRRRRRTRRSASSGREPGSGPRRGRDPSLARGPRRSRPRGVRPRPREPGRPRPARRQERGRRRPWAHPTWVGDGTRGGRQELSGSPESGVLSAIGKRASVE